MNDNIPKIGGCRGCGYDLRGIESRNCPECGRRFDPADPQTIGQVGMPFGPMARWAIASTGWPLRIFTAVILLLILWHARYPHAVRGDSRIYRSLWPMLLALWVGRLFFQLLARARMHEKPLRRKVRLPRTILMMAVIVTFAIMVRKEFICRLCLGISRPAFVRIGGSMPSNDVKFPQPRWVGLYRIESASTYDSGAMQKPDISFKAAEGDAWFNLSFDRNEFTCYGEGAGYTDFIHDLLW